MSVPVHWVVALMVALEPRAAWRDTFDKTAEVIGRIAESEPLFDDAHGEERTAALLVAVAWYESRLKPNAKSANGRWVCLFQVDKRHLSDPQQALDDPEVCTRQAMKILRASLKLCRGRPLNDRLAHFTSGRCDRGIDASRYRMHLANKLLKEHPIPVASESDGGGGDGAAHAR